MTRRRYPWLAVAAILVLPGVADAQSAGDEDAPAEVPTLPIVVGAEPIADDDGGPDPLTTPPEIPKKPKRHIAADDPHSGARGYLCVGVGLGALAGNEGGTDPVTGLNLRLGLMVAPAIGAGFELNGLAHAKTVSGDTDYGLGSVGASVVFWLGARASLSFGVGYAELFRRPRDGGPATESSGVASSAAFAYQVWRSDSGKTGVEVQVRAFGATYDGDSDFGGLVVLFGFGGFGAE